MEIIKALSRMLKDLEQNDPDVHLSFMRMLGLITISHNSNPDAKCVMIYTDGESLLAVGANISDSEMDDLLNDVREHRLLISTKDAPPREMFN